MPKTNLRDRKLTTTDDLFRLDREDETGKDTLNISLELIDPFPNHPFRVIHDDELDKLAESIKEHGVFHKVILRPKGNRYELIAGDRRVEASKLAGKDSIPAIVEDMDDERATMIMVDSNLRQRQELLPSEKAFAYKMRLEAMKRKAGRPAKENVSQVGTQKRSDQLLAEETGESRNQISRFIRLTYLVPPLLEKVDSKKLPLNPAVELSFLTEEEQTMVFDIMVRDQTAPTLEQAKRLREASEKDELNHTVLSMVLMDGKPSKGNISLKASAVRAYYPTANAKEIEESLVGLASTYARLREYFPPNTPQDEITSMVIRLVDRNLHSN